MSSSACLVVCALGLEGDDGWPGSFCATAAFNTRAAARTAQGTATPRMATLHVFVSRICTVAFSGRLLHSTTRRPKLCRSCGSWTVIAPNAGACCDSRTGHGCVVGRVIDCRPSLGRLTLIGTSARAHRFGVLRFRLMVKRGPRAERIDHWLTLLWQIFRRHGIPKSLFL